MTEFWRFWTTWAVESNLCRPWIVVVVIVQAPYQVYLEALHHNQLILRLLNTKKGTAKMFNLEQSNKRSPKISWPVVQFPWNVSLFSSPASWMKGFSRIELNYISQPRLVFQLIKTLLYLRNFKTFPGITTQGINNCIWTVPYGRSELSQLKVCFRKLQSQGGAISLDNLLYTHLGWCERKQLQKINIIIQSLGLLF